MVISLSFYNPKMKLRYNSENICSSNFLKLSLKTNKSLKNHEEIVRWQSRILVDGNFFLFLWTETEEIVRYKLICEFHKNDEQKK